MTHLTPAQVVSLVVTYIGYVLVLALAGLSLGALQFALLENSDQLLDALYTLSEWSYE